LEASAFAESLGISGPGWTTSNPPRRQAPRVPSAQEKNIVLPGGKTRNGLWTQGHVNPAARLGREWASRQVRAGVGAGPRPAPLWGTERHNASRPWVWGGYTRWTAFRVPSTSSPDPTAVARAVPPSSLSRWIPSRRGSPGTSKRAAWPHSDWQPELPEPPYGAASPRGTLSCKTRVSQIQGRSDRRDDERISATQRSPSRRAGATVGGETGESGGGMGFTGDNASRVSPGGIVSRGEKGYGAVPITRRYGRMEKEKKTVMGIRREPRPPLPRGREDGSDSWSPMATFSRGGGPKTDPSRRRRRHRRLSDPPGTPGGKPSPGSSGKIRPGFFFLMDSGDGRHDGVEVGRRQIRFRPRPIARFGGS